MMNIKAGEVVSVRHYSDSNLFRSVVDEQTHDIITVKFVEVNSLFECSEEDPIVLGFELEDKVHIASCNILHIHKEERKLVLKIDNIEVLANKRLSERFPVSFHSDIKIGEAKTKYIAIVKNISVTGMMIYSKSDFPLYQKLKIRINIGVKIVLSAIIVRKVKESDNFEYGLKIVYTDTNTPGLLKKYLLALKREQEEFVRKIKVV